MRGLLRLKGTSKYMRAILTILIGLHLAGCSCDESDLDLQFTKRHMHLYESYSPKDTIYFVSNHNDWDTLVIAAMDSSTQCGGLMTARGKRVTVEIKHLPKNNWNGGSEHSYGRSTILNQELITIEKLPQAYKSYFIGVNYRNFWGKISNINAVHHDSLLLDLGISEYWEINNDRLESPLYKQDSTQISKMFGIRNLG
jgi:hypothetical protein